MELHNMNRRVFLSHTAAAVGAGLLSGVPGTKALAQLAAAGSLEQAFLQPPAAAKPWVFWYWMKASFSRAGITADLEAMKEAGIGGAYLMPIKGVTDPPLMQPPIPQLSPEWWGMVKHAMQEADRLGLQLAMHVCDGFALAGGPWITPEQSMQKIVSTEILAAGNRRYNGTLPQPPAYKDYYRDIAVFAFPAPAGAEQSTRTIQPKVTTSQPSTDAAFLAVPGSKESFRSKEPCWIQYAFDQPFTCRNIKIYTNGNNYQSHRLFVEVSDDGHAFRPLARLEPPRHGWQDTDAAVTHAITPVRARFFRFRYDQAGAEPGAEDLDAAKWKPSLKISGIELSGMPRLHQFEGKAGEVWRVSPRTTTGQLPDELCIPRNSIIDISRYMDAQGRLSWDVPAGRWIILRMGHTSTGHTNATGGAGQGLECDKFDPAVVRLQFDRWFGEAIRTAGPELAARALKMFHVDSWECGSQNWSPVFREAFRQRRGYDPLPYLPAMAGIPVQSADTAERFLHDVRQTIAELVVENFYHTLANLAHRHGCSFSAECVAPTMTSDGMLHYQSVDVPMGEFWLNSPTHDKPNDMLDAISGAHIYGKRLIQAEAFTTLRMTWDEHPGMLKALGDRSYALGINRLVYHVFTHNPWMDQRPGMTLDGIGLYFQRDQTWWKPGRAWVQYAQRCQALLQQGVPVADIAVFTGEETPRRALLPDRLVGTLPGIFGEATVAREQQRLANKGEPQRELPAGVVASANMADPEDWIDPMHGYAYDSINRDALLRLAQVRNGRIVLPGGASYALLVLPGPHPMQRDDKCMSPEVAARLLQLVKDGATLLVSGRPDHTPGLSGSNEALQRAVNTLWNGNSREIAPGLRMWRVGKGSVVQTPYTAPSFDVLGVMPDVTVREADNKAAGHIAWAHRSAPGLDIYFIANQQAAQRHVHISFRIAGRVPELWDPVTGEIRPAGEWRTENGRTVVPLQLVPNGSLFIVMRKPARSASFRQGRNWRETAAVQPVEGPWQVAFDPAMGGPAQPVTFNSLDDWSRHTQPGIRYYAGTAVYTTVFHWKEPAAKQRIWLDLGHVANLAEVTLNGRSCGIAWTPPYRVEITAALQPGENRLQVAVSNTWANRLIGDQQLPEAQRITRTTAPYRLEGSPLREAGLRGPVVIRM